MNLGFILFGVCLASGICRFMSFVKFEKGNFEPLFLEYFFPTHPFFCGIWNSDDMSTWNNFLGPLPSLVFYVLPIRMVGFMKQVRLDIVIGL
jgi:hypothetical protein